MIKRFRVALACGVLLALYPLGSILWAECLAMPQGEIVTIEVQSCEEIIAEKNKEVIAHGPLYGTWDWRKGYTGALVKDVKGIVWMYPSESTAPCKQFAPEHLSTEKGVLLVLRHRPLGKMRLLGILARRWRRKVDQRVPIKLGLTNQAVAMPVGGAD